LDEFNHFSGKPFREIREKVHLNICLRKILERPFPEEAISQTPVREGKHPLPRSIKSSFESPLFRTFAM